MRVDIKAKLEDLEVRRTPIFSGIRPTIRVKDDYLTTSMIQFEEQIESGGFKDVDVMLISPQYYANSLWIGKRLEVYEGAKKIGYITVKEIINPILDKYAEKWALLDGRKIHTEKEFYQQVQSQMTEGINFQIDHNLSAFSDILWGGFGMHEYEEPLHIVWIYSGESRQYLGKELFDAIVDLIENHESGNKYLELYEEHAFQ